MKSVAVIGSGFSGISAACFLAKEGFEVTVFESNSTPGGRARSMSIDGFTFDMGPSWYWMPDVFESFFSNFNKRPSDYYQLERLDPSYRVFYSKSNVLDIPAGVKELCALFEQLESGSSVELLRLLDEAKYKYTVGMRDLVYKPCRSLREFLEPDLLKSFFRLHVFKSMSAYVKKYFKDPRLIQLLEFPVLFLGGAPDKIPALYSLMNYADMSLGTWYPKGGINRVVAGMADLAKSLGVRFEFGAAVQQITVKGSKAAGIRVNNTELHFDYILASADYHHVESLLPAPFRNYNESYWTSRVLAPSSLIFYVGINRKLKNLQHHNLFFEANFQQHLKQIYDAPAWPGDPLFYVCCPSKSDRTVAPPGHENIFILIPVASGLEDNDETREKYFDLIINRLEDLTRQKIREYIVVKKSYAHRDFIADYHAYRGNAYGLANTLWQTAHLKPSVVNKKLTNLFYSGQLTIPGPGMPSALI